jgi:hypothetical protein
LYWSGGKYSGQGELNGTGSMEELARQLYQEKKHEIEIAFS